MNKNPIDRLFRNKLEDINFPPSYKAWEKLQSGLNEQKGVNPWRLMSIAAGVVLLALIGYFLYIRVNTDVSVEENTMAGLAEESKSPDREQTQATDEVVKSVEDKKEIENIIAQSEKSYGQTETSIAVIKKLSLDLHLQKVGFAKKELKKVEVPAIDLDLQWAMLDNDTNEEKQSVTITYKIGELSPSTQASISQTQEEQGKSAKSKLKKAWEFAKDVKNGEEKLPNIRELKNDLLAFNKKKKSKTLDN